jgi:hypothetical protein
MDMKLTITGLSKQVADNLINQTPINRLERSNSRIGWEYIVLRIDLHQVGFIRCARGQQPLTVEIDLNALKEHDVHWLTTLETLGVLK